MQAANENIQSVKRLESLCEEINALALQQKGVTALSVGYIVESIRRIGEYAEDISETAINYLVGEPDNITPQQLITVLSDLSITSASDIYDLTKYNSFQTNLKTTEEYQQKILSSMLMFDPYSSQPDTLPVIYKMMGQRFIIDSYILGNVIYDKIIYNGTKILRLMPRPLDAMYVLGNDNAALLLEDELEE